MTTADRSNETTTMGQQQPTEDEAQDTALDELLEKVDLTSPLEIPLDSGKVLNITKEDFISYYLPADATGPEKAKCFNETRAAGLNPAIKGDCHYFRIDGTLSLFVGYHVYVRKAYRNGLEHIGKPELVYDEETGQLDSCIITLEIEGRKEFVWETWYSEVEGQTKGQTNKRWAKAGRQMLIKCSVTNTLRMAGIATLGILPPMVDEMPDFPTSGQRTLTPAQAEGHELPEVSLGEVTATTHQIDMTPFRKTYFRALKERNILQDDKGRKDWQQTMTGKRSTSDWDVADYATAMDVIHKVEKPGPDPDPPATESVPESVTDDPASSGTEEKDTPDEDFLITKETLEAIKHELAIFPDKQYRTMRSIAFKTFASEVVGVELDTFNIKVILESDGQDIVTVLQEQRAELELAEKAAQGIPKAEPEDDPEDNPSGTQAGEITEDFVTINEDDVDFIEPYIHKAHARFSTKLQRKQWEGKNELPDLMIGDWPKSELKRGIEMLDDVPEIVNCTSQQRAVMESLVQDMPNKYGGTLHKQPFKTFIFKIVERKIEHLSELTESEASDIIHEMNDAIQDAANKHVI